MDKKTGTYIAKNQELDITKELEIKTDGEYEIFINAKDEAGNKSDTNTVYVYKDSVAPEIGTAAISDITSDGFTIQAGARDELSGIAKYVCMIGEEEKGNTTEAGGVIEVTGLIPETTYQNVRVRSYDNAGNYKDTFGVTVTTQANIKAPVITILNNNTWTREKTAQIQGIEGYTIMYTLDGTTPTATTGTELTGIGIQNITMNRENCRIRAVYINNKTNKVTDVGTSEEGKIDRTGPSITLNLTSGDTTVSASWSATDSKSGLNSTAYRYKLDYESSYSSWTSSTSASKSGVVNGTSGRSGYFYIEARDSLGNTSSTSKYYSTNGNKIINIPNADKYTFTAR